MWKSEFTISENTGKDILKWCNEGVYKEVDNYKTFNAPNKGVNSLSQINPKEAFERNSFTPSVDLSFTTEKKYMRLYKPVILLQSYCLYISNFLNFSKT